MRRSTSVVLAVLTVASVAAAVRTGTLLAQQRQLHEAIVAEHEEEVRLLEERRSLETSIARSVVASLQAEAKALRGTVRALEEDNEGLRRQLARKPRVVYVSRVSRSVGATGWRTANASWYGPGFYGNTMAGGGTLTPTSMVVAHRTLPFGTQVAIRYRGKTVTAVVKDRGPHVAGRVFDLGPGVAKALGFSGVGNVEWKVVN